MHPPEKVRALTAAAVSIAPKMSALEAHSKQPLNEGTSDSTSSMRGRTDTATSSSDRVADRRPGGSDSQTDPDHARSQSYALMQQERFSPNHRAAEPDFLEITPIASITDGQVGAASGLPVKGKHERRDRPGHKPHDGSKPQPSQSAEETDSGTQRPRRPPDSTPDPTLSDAHARVAADANKFFSDNPAALAAFQHDMSAFEQRMHAKPNGDQEVARTYKQLSRLMEGHSSIVKDADRLQIARDVMSGAARGVGSNQGSSLDCAAAYMTDRLYTNDPAEAARAVADITLTGTYQDASGRKITLDHDTIATHRTQLSDEERKYGIEVRTHGDQILQAVVRNEYLADLNRLGDNVRYEIHNPTKDNPTGEFVYDYSKKPPEDVSDSFQGMPSSSSTLESLYKDMTGKDQWESFATNVDQGAGAQARDFKDMLKAARERGDFPLLIEVNDGQEPFKSSMGIRDGNEMLHAITVTGYNPETGEVQYRNPNFASRRLSISAEDLFNAMHLHRSQKDIDENVKSIQGLAEQIKQHPENARSSLFAYVWDTEPEQRKQVLFELSKRSGVNLLDVLTPEQRARLNVDPNFFDHLFGRAP